jgi:hypothetical protein
MKENEAIVIDQFEQDDLINFLEHSFNIEFDWDELTRISTFGQLCDIIESKITDKHEESCTSQQAFYKLRSAIASVLKLNEQKISLDCRLETLFPRKDRKLLLHEVEWQLQFEINLLVPKKVAYIPVIITGLASSYMLFINSD